MQSNFGRRIVCDKILEIAKRHKSKSALANVRFHDALDYIEEGEYDLGIDCLLKSIEYSISAYHKDYATASTLSTWEPQYSQF